LSEEEEKRLSRLEKRLDVQPGMLRTRSVPVVDG
jgi:hypothetical protein